MPRGESEPQDPNSPGAQLRKLREEAGFSVTEFAKLIERAKSGVSEVERGKRTPSQQMVRAYEKVLLLEKGSLVDLYEQALHNAPRRISESKQSSLDFPGDVINSLLVASGLNEEDRRTVGFQIIETVLQVIKERQNPQA